MNFTTVISTDELDEHFDSQNWVIFDCRSSLSDQSAGLRAYNEGHIPNAHFCHLEEDLSSPITENSGRHPLPDFDVLIKKLGDWGVDSDTQVIVYDDSAGAIAVRLWWQLRTFGHKNVAVLNGGIPQWMEEEKPLNQEIPEVTAKTFSANIDNSAWLTTEQVFNNLTSNKYLILDGRTEERYRGDVEPIDTVAGRIPDSINYPFLGNVGNDGLFLSENELRNQYNAIVKQAPDKSAENIVHVCGSGVTALHNMLAMEIAGLTGSKLYVGSWSEWIRDSSHPVATGDA